MFILISAASAAVSINDFNIEKSGSGYNVIVSLENSLNSTDYTGLTFYIEELGVEKVMNNGNLYALSGNSTETKKFSLEDIVNDISLLKKGEVYNVKVQATYNNNVLDEKTVSFLYGDDLAEENLGLIFNKIEINGIEATTLSNVEVMAGDTLTLDMFFEATKNVEGARLRAEIDGYEHEVLTDTTEIFKIVDGTKYSKELTISLPEDMDSEEVYTLRIFGVGDLSGITYKEYRLYVNTDRHKIDILDFITTPSSGIEAGQNIIANVRLKNRGQFAEDSIKVTVSIPELGVSESSYVSALDKDESVTSDDMLLFVPQEAEAKEYDVEVSLTYNDGHTQSSKNFKLNVLPTIRESEKPLVVSFNNNLQLEAGKTKEFEVVIANPNDDSKPISLGVVENVWADVEVSPTLRMIEGGKDASFVVKVTPKEEVSGEKSIGLLIKEENRVIKEISIDTYVNKVEKDEGFEYNIVNIVLAVLLVIAILILLSLIASLIRKNKDNDDNSSEEEEYY